MTEANSEARAAVALLSTAPDADEAARIARTLVEERLAACVNIVPGVRSIYAWEGKVHDEGELLLLIKTTVERRDAVVARIQEVHPYSCPEAVVLPVVGGSRPYLEWVAEVTR